MTATQGKLNLSYAESMYRMVLHVIGAQAKWMNSLISGCGHHHAVLFT